MRTIPIRLTWIVLSVLAFSVYACNRQTSRLENGYTIHGKVKTDILYGEKAMLIIYNSDGSISKDSTTIAVDGRFSFVGEINDVCLSEIKIQSATTDLNLSYQFFLENNNIRVTVVPAQHEYGEGYFEFKVRGSNADQRYRRESKDAYCEYPGYMVEVYEDRVDECLAEHSDAFYAPYLYFQTIYSDSDYPDFVKQMESFTGDALESYHYKLLSEKYDLKKELAINNRMPNFTMRNDLGDTVNLLKTAAGKRYVLVDFWASWCGPCLKEFKLLKKLHCRYRDKGFDVIGVSIDQDPAKWKRVLEDENPTWVNVIDSDTCSSTVFGVKGIPDNYLIDNTGKIIARNLHGTELENKIDKLMIQYDY